MLEFTLYNPTINVFVPIRAFVRRTLAGAVKPDVDLLTALLLHGRFQPSIIFEVILLAVAVVQVRCQIHSCLACLGALTCEKRVAADCAYDCCHVEQWLPRLDTQRMEYSWCAPHFVAAHSRAL